MDIATYTPETLELERELQQSVPGLVIYRDAPEGFAFEIGGRHYWIPPDLHNDEAMVEHPFITECALCGVSSVRSCSSPEAHEPQPLMVRADGRLEVKQVYGVLRDDKGKPAGLGPLKGFDPIGLVRYVVNNYGRSQGCVWLKGDGTDRQRMKASRKLYLAGRIAWATQEVEARQEYVRRFELNPNNRGRVPPPPMPTQLRAQEILDEQDAETRAEHICLVCYGYETDDPKAFARHMKRSHNRDWEPDKAESVARKETEAALERAAAEAAEQAGAAPSRRGRNR